jgi:hypothetical protein
MTQCSIIQCKQESFLLNAVNISSNELRSYRRLDIIVLATFSPIFDIIHESSRDASLDTLLDEKLRILILVDLLQIKTFRNNNISSILKLSLQRLVSDLRLLPLTIILRSPGIRRCFPSGLRSFSGSGEAWLGRTFVI